MIKANNDDNLVFVYSLSLDRKNMTEGGVYCSRSNCNTKQEFLQILANIKKFIEEMERVNDV